jgi:hypothetical protein
LESSQILHPSNLIFLLSPTRCISTPPYIGNLIGGYNWWFYIIVMDLLIFFTFEAHRKFELEYSQIAQMLLREKEEESVRKVGPMELHSSRTLVNILFVCITMR